MAFNVVTFKQYPGADEQFAVFHTTTETMFSETFGQHEELDAYIFASFYYEHRRLFRIFTEQQQRGIARMIHEWLDEIAPHPLYKGLRGDKILYQERLLPQAWIDRLNPPDDEEEDVCTTLQREAISDPRYTLDQLLEDFRNGDCKVQFVVDEFTDLWKTRTFVAQTIADAASQGGSNR